MNDIKILRFTASWCSPCKRYAPIFSEFVEENDINAEEIDIDESPELAQHYGVMSVPTTVILNKGNTVVGSVSGAISKPALRRLVEDVS